MSFRQPICRVISKKKYILEEDYSVHLVDSKQGIFELRIEKGEIWDGNSRPRSLSWFVRRGGAYLGASIVHDYLYSKGGHVGVRYLSSYSTFKNIPTSFDRKECDQFYADILEMSDISSYKIFGAYWGIRAFGGFYWNKNKG
jgi:hypothetical protein